MTNDQEPTSGGMAPWSHQDELARLKGKMVKLTMVSGGQVRRGEGILLNADALALQIAISDDGSGHLETRTYFKHALLSYMALPE